MSELTVVVDGRAQLGAALARVVRVLRGVVVVVDGILIAGLQRLLSAGHHGF